MTDAKTRNEGHGKLRDGVDTARDAASQAYETARDKATSAVEASREKARETARQTAESIDSNPLAVVVGGLALGALVGAVIPRGRREKELLAPVGRRISAGASAAIAAAKDAGKSELDELGLSRTAAKNQVKSVFEGLAKAASSAGSAAVRAGKDEVKSR